MRNRKINPDDTFLALIWAFIVCAIIVGGTIVTLAHMRGAEAEARQTMNAAHYERVFLSGGSN